MTLLLKGRYGYYAPRNPQERLRARNLEATRKKLHAAELDWREKHRWCANGCGQETAFYEGLYPSLRFGGCCSEACQRARDALTPER